MQHIKHKEHRGHKGAIRRVTITAVVTFVSLVLISAEAHAEIVFFSSGRTLSVKGHRAEGDSIVLELRGGGEIICESTIVARFAPDEVPYPEPEVAQPVAVAAVEPPSDVPYGAIIDKVSAQQDVSAKLVRAVIQVESAYRERARSPKGAMGLMQLMPATARQYGVADPYDPQSNIEAGIKHLKSLMLRLPVAHALAAYNAGEAAVQRFNGIPPYAETRSYVSRILSLANR
jgi:soluble lytic murein transglycosylase-like protein